MATNIQLPSKENLAETLDIGNFTTNGQQIIPLNGDGGLDLRSQNTDNVVVLTNDFTGASGYLVFAPGAAQLGLNATSGLYLEITPNEALLRTVALVSYFVASAANGGLRNITQFGSGFGLVIVNNSVDRSQGNVLGENVFLNTSATIKSGVENTVVASGQGQTAKTSNTLYCNQISLQESGSLFDNILKFPTAATQDNLYTFPNESGEVQLKKWLPPAVGLGSVLTSGATFFINPGAGVYIAFDGASDDTIFFNSSLSQSGIEYDGSDIQIVLKGRLSSNGAAGNTVGLILNYGINGNGDDSTLSTIVAQQNVDVSSELQDIQFEIVLATIPGVVGANQLMVDITRNSTGAGSDTYGGTYELTAIMINKV